MRVCVFSALAVALGGCSLLTGFSGYHSAGGGDGGLDGSTRDGGEDTCDPACGTSGECVAGVCRCGSGDACASDRTCCEGECIDPASAVEHCGGCARRCPGGERATRTCVDSICGLDCEDGFEDCDPGVPGCEADLATPAHCGACNAACAGAMLCGIDGTGERVCVDSCGTGEAECSGSCVDTSTSLSHCGSCNAACASLDNVTTTCESASCGYACVGEFADCDGDLGDPSTSNGCEEVPPNRFEDADDDGWGNSAVTMRVCPTASSPGYSTLSGDCDDGSAALNPGNPELCNGIDDNCDFAFDEGYDVGGACSCTPGAASGALECTPDAMGTSCALPAEMCANGLDDDCDGDADESCGPDLDGDLYSPPDDCDDTNAAINPGAPDVCNGIDDDCDGFADGDLVALAPQTVGAFSTTGGSSFPYEPSVTWLPERSTGAVVWGSQRGASAHEIRFVLIDAAGSAVISDRAVASFPGSPEEIHVAWDGGAWSVVFSTGVRAQRVRVDDAGTVVTPLEELPGVVGETVFQLGVAQGDGGMAVVAGVNAVEMRALVFRNATLRRSMVLLPLPGMGVYRPAVAHIGGGVFGAVVQSPADSGMLYQRFSASGLEGSAARILGGGPVEYPGDATYEPLSGRVAFTYNEPSSPGELLLLEATTGAVFATLGAFGPGFVPVGAADDGSVIAVEFSPTPPLRVRASDAATYPPVPASSPSWADVDGLPGTAHRFIGVSAVGGSGTVETQVLTCR